MIEPGFGIFFRRLRVQRAAQVSTGPGGIAVDQIANGIDDVGFRPGQPVLHRQEIGADILGNAGDEAKDLRKTAQRAQLLLPCLCLVAGAAQTLHQRDGTGGRLRHVEPVKAGQLDHFCGGHAADDGVTVCPARLQGRQHRADMIFQEQHRSKNHIGRGDVIVGCLKGAGLAVPFRGGMEGEFQARDLAAQHTFGAGNRPAKMGVERNDHDPDGCLIPGDALSGHNAPLHHRGCRG